MHREGDARADVPVCSGNPRTDVRPLRVELEVEHPRLVLGPTLTRLPDATIRSTDGLDARAASSTFFDVSGASPDETERALATDHTISDCRCVASGERSRTYRVRVTGDAVVLSDAAAERGVEIRSASSAGAGWRLVLSAPDREAVSSFREYCRSRGVAVSIERLCQCDEWSSRAPAMSERHRETLRAALAEGYFEIPRAGTQDDLAEHLGVSGSAVSQRLRRATRELVARNFGEGDDESVCHSTTTR